MAQPGELCCFDIDAVDGVGGLLGAVFFGGTEFEQRLSGFTVEGFNFRESGLDGEVFCGDKQAEIHGRGRQRLVCGKDKGLGGT